jgi:hypothetical protein
MPGARIRPGVRCWPDSAIRGKEPSPAVNMQPQIEALEALAAVDADLKELNEELDRERETLAGQRSHLDELDESLSRAHQSIEDMERMRNELMQEVRQMSLQVEKSREKLSRCRTEREANAAQREVEEIRKLYRDREVEIEKLVGLIDQARGDIEKTQTEHDELADELGKSQSSVESHLGEVEQRAKAKQDERKQYVAKVKPQLYRRYELVRKRKGTAIAYASDGTCSACHMLLPPMLFQQLRRGEDFGQCPSCNRILYFRADPPAAESSQADSQSSGP